MDDDVDHALTVVAWVLLIVGLLTGNPGLIWAALGIFIATLFLI